MESRTFCLNFLAISTAAVLHRRNSEYSHIVLDDELVNEALSLTGKVELAPAKTLT